MQTTETHPTPIVTTDAVVLTLQDGALHVLVTARPDDPFAGMRALPGGYVRPGEDADAEAAITRILRDKTGLGGFHLEQLACFSGSDRDPRGWSVSVAYMALVRRADLGELPDGVELVAVEGAKGFAFDHDDILSAALQRLQNKGAWSNLPALLLPREFTLPEIQGVYEAVRGTKLDQSSFRRKLNELRLVEETGNSRQERPGRPAKLYRIAGDQDYAGRTFDRML